MKPLLLVLVAGLCLAPAAEAQFPFFKKKKKEPPPIEAAAKGPAEVAAPGATPPPPSCNRESTIMTTTGNIPAARPTCRMFHRARGGDDARSAELSGGRGHFPASGRRRRCGQDLRISPSEAFVPPTAGMVASQSRHSRRFRTRHAWTSVLSGSTRRSPQIRSPSLQLCAHDVAQGEHALVRQFVDDEQAVTAARHKTVRVQQLQMLRQVRLVQLRCIHQLRDVQWPFPQLI